MLVGLKRGLRVFIRSVWMCMRDHLSPQKEMRMREHCLVGKKPDK